jgi:hypothetical protein
MKRQVKQTAVCSQTTFMIDRTMGRRSTVCVLACCTLAAFSISQRPTALSDSTVSTSHNSDTCWQWFYSFSRLQSRCRLPLFTAYNCLCTQAVRLNSAKIIQCNWRKYEPYITENVSLPRIHNRCLTQTLLRSPKQTGRMLAVAG